MKAIYELGRLASNQRMREALPDPEGLRALIRGGFAQRDAQGNYKLSLAGETLALEIRAIMRRLGVLDP